MMSLVDPLASAMSANLNSMMSGAYSNTKAKRMRGQRIDVSPAQDLSRQKLRSRCTTWLSWHEAAEDGAYLRGVRWQCRSPSEAAKLIEKSRGIILVGLAFRHVLCVVIHCCADYQ